MFEGSDSVRGKVAIVGSQDAIVDVLRTSFEAEGFRVAVASDGEGGLALCGQFLPQVVLVDTALPDVDGFEVSRRLRRTTRTSHVHIILMADTADREARIRGLETGADDFIVIPFDPAEVTLRVRNALWRAAMDNRSDPITGLPSGRLIRAHLSDLLEQEEGWALLRPTVRFLREFEAAHGFLAAHEVLSLVAVVLSETVQQAGGPDDFVGHSGGGRFVVVTGAERVDALETELLTRLQEVVQAQHAPQEREQGYMVVAEGETRLPLMALEIRRLLASDGPFYDIRSLTEALG